MKILRLSANGNKPHCIFIKMNLTNSLFFVKITPNQFSPLIMDIPKASEYVSKWLPKAQRVDDLSEEMSELRPAELKSINQMLVTGFELRNTRFRALLTRKGADERHGKNVLSYRYDENRLENEISSYELLRDSIDRAINQ